MSNKLKKKRPEESLFNMALKKTVDHDLYDLFFHSCKEGANPDKALNDALRMQEIRSQNIIADSLRPQTMELKPGQIHIRFPKKKK